MMENEQDWMRAVERTWIVRFPKQHLATFGATNLSYYVVTEPIYEGLNAGTKEGVVRTGRVIAEKPTVVTPFYAMNLQGFSDEAYDYFRYLSNRVGPNAAGVLYQYRNQPEKTDIVSGLPDEIAARISDDLDQTGFGGVPRAATEQIEKLFREVEGGSGNPDVLKQQLDRWGLFGYYEDRFLSLFRRRKI